MADVVGVDAKVFGRSGDAGFTSSSLPRAMTAICLLSDWSKKLHIERILKVQRLIPTLDVTFMILLCILFSRFQSRYVPLVPW